MLGTSSLAPPLINASTAASVRAWAREHLLRDAHGKGQFGDEYRTTTLYFDTPDLAVLRRRGSWGRAKYRVRRYDDEEMVFLERKLRTPNVLIKRRTPVALSELPWLAGAGAHRDWTGWWFWRRIEARSLWVACRLRYKRMARLCPPSDGVARLTLDDHATVLPAYHLQFDGGDGIGILADQSILELKYRGGLPAAFRRLVERFRLQPTTASKYRLGMAVLSPIASDTASRSQNAPGH